MDFTAILHGLATFGVYILNVLIYESIALVIWFPISYCLYNSSSVPEPVGDEIARKLGLGLIWVFLAMCVLCLFGIGRIVPFPTFG